MDNGPLVALEGGPEGLPSVCRVEDAVLADRERVVIAYCGRNEHFARTGETRRLADGEVPLFRWSYGTVIAE
ncbi:DUF5988 family protein [Streptomyces sp. R28]|uniref:DUF5988 family protein n=1 Tax=Streptomyces sp. R28 TaxID=3238628 RepID=A0AB39Q494_9ACTN